MSNGKRKKSAGVDAPNGPTIKSLMESIPQGAAPEKDMDPRCLCGQAMTFPEDQNIAHCKTEGCGVRWERTGEGYWAIGLTRQIFTPLFAKPEKRKPSHYQKQMAWRNKLRKAGK